MPKLTARTIRPKRPPLAATNGTITEVQVFRNTPEKTWRVFLNMLPKPGNHDPVDLKCALNKGDDRSSETWSYRWSPP